MCPDLQVPLSCHINVAPTPTKKEKKREARPHQRFQLSHSLLNACVVSCIARCCFIVAARLLAVSVPRNVARVVRRVASWHLALV